MRTPHHFLLVATLALGILAPRVEAGTLSVTFTTTPVGGQYAPRNVVAVWIQNQNGTFVKTIGRWANARKQHLVAWTTAAGANDADAVSGATRATHATPLTVTWNLLDKQNAEVPDSTYTIRMELTDLNANTAAQNHQGTFTFVKGTAAQVQSALTNGGFTNVSITYTPTASAADCNNGVLDAGEICDPGVAGSCPSTCVASAEACAPNVLIGAAATCTAACVTQTISACVDGDGCCAVGCDEASDSDCAPGGGGGGGGGETGGAQNEISGGCATAGGNGSAFVLGLLGLLVVVSTRKRRPQR